MQSVILDGELLLTREDVHKALREGLAFPEWYGNNLDALHDVLTERTEDMSIKLTNRVLLEEHLGDYAVYLLRVLQDCAEENPHLHIVF